MNCGISWLVNTVLGKSRLTRLEAAFALLAFSSMDYRELTVKSADNHRLAIDKAAKALMEKIRFGWPLQMVEYYEHVHYSAPDLSVGSGLVAGQSHRKNRYMFYPAEVITALALLRSPYRKNASQYICSVVKKLSDMTEPNGMYIAAPTGREALSDAYWITEFLRGFRQVVGEEPLSLVSSPFRLMANKLFVRLALVMVAIGCAIATYFSATLPDGTAKVLSVTAAGLFGTLLFPILLAMFDLRGFRQTRSAP